MQELGSECSSGVTDPSLDTTWTGDMSSEDPASRLQLLCDPEWD